MPMVMMPFSKSRRAMSATDFETWKASDVSNTINTFDRGDVRATDIVVMATQRYIVRRLTPLECCRLQGFPDGWGEIDPKDEFTDEEYEFWTDVRRTFEQINGRTPKEYTREQMLSWYNKLHSDSNEYKMWGNGISLPTAYFVLSRMAKLFEEEVNDDN